MQNIQFGNVRNLLYCDVTVQVWAPI